MPEEEIIETKESNIEIQEEEEKKTTIIVHVAGCVENEGIVELEEGDRIDDAIKKAGGITSDANLTQVNLAYKLKDGQKIYIPSNIDDNVEIITQKADGIETENNQKQGGKININTATQTELETLPRNRPFNG